MMQVNTDSLENIILSLPHVLSLPSLAPVCGAAAASPSHPEPGEPPVPAGPDIWSAAVRAAQMAAVHPIQDGSGGDPVVRGGLTVLPHVTYSLGTSGSFRSLDLHASTFWAE